MTFTAEHPWERRGRIFEIAKKNYRILIGYCTVLSEEGYWEQAGQILGRSIYEMFDLYLQSALLCMAAYGKSFNTAERQFIVALPDSKQYEIPMEGAIPEEPLAQAERILKSPPIILQLCGLRDREHQSDLTGSYFDALLNILVAMSWMNESREQYIVRFVKDFYQSVEAFLFVEGQQRRLNSRYVFRKISGDLEQPEERQEGFQGVAGVDKADGGCQGNLPEGRQAGAARHSETVPDEKEPAPEEAPGKQGYSEPDHQPGEQEDEAEGEMDWEQYKGVVWDGEDEEREEEEWDSQDANDIAAGEEAGGTGETEETAGTEETAETEEITDTEDAAETEELAGTEDTAETEELAELTDTAETSAAQDASGNAAGYVQENQEQEPQLSGLDVLLEELYELVGLQEVKEEIRSLINLIKIRRLRSERGLPALEMTYHMVFTGSPGTGKTTVARLVAKIYKELGLLSKGTLVETDRSGLVAGYVGQTALKVKEVVDRALGGVLFIDEAYSLSTGGAAGNDFGGEAIDTLVKLMEDHREDLVVIVAGYTEEMKAFLASNTGLVSRFNKFIEFPDYSDGELIQILRSMADKMAMELAEGAGELLSDLFSGMTQEERRIFGNARGVRNLFEKSVIYQANRLVEVENPTISDLSEITRGDLEYAVGIVPQAAQETAAVSQSLDETENV